MIMSFNKYLLQYLTGKFDLWGIEDYWKNANLMLYGINYYTYIRVYYCTNFFIEILLIFLVILYKAD